MTSRTIKEQRLFPSQVSKKPFTTFRPPKKSRTNASSSFSTDPLGNTIITRTEATPKTRIVVVRSSSRTQNEQGETNELEQPNSVQFPPVLTNGLTSVYLIRRPIPPSESSIQTKIYQPTDDEPPIITTTDNTLTNTENTETSPGQVFSLVIRTQEEPPVDTNNEIPTVHSPDSEKHLTSSLTQSGNISQKITRQSRSKSQRRNLARSRSKSRSTSRRRPRRIPSKSRLPSSLSSGQEEPKANLTVENIRQPITRNSQRKTIFSPRIKSSKSIVLVNPEDQTIAVVENPYLKGESITQIIKRPIPMKNNRFLENEELTEVSKKEYHKGNTCLDCLSRCICLIIIICVILALIGLAGVGVSAYFLATDSQTDFIPKIVGIVVGGVLAIIALTFLYCVLACIGSRDGYFSYNDDSSHTGGRVFAVIPSTHPNAHLYTPRDNIETYKNNQTSTLNSTIQQQTINRQKTIINDVNTTTTTNTKNIIIQMPERLLTARKTSPKSQERKINQVVNDIGRIVQDAKKRYNGDISNKVIVKVDENVKPLPT
ncbi:unnamed protein product [Rotaria sordida]|uniref:Uncharacterized protein n=1 Tax=Rotaria sordida TaxID=392033 RepID=A0A818LHL7_9BILA|nr:unnamed protein product [Rotaria sordida]CAF3572797.1 unnamed protein product [Rotaria sordida]